MKTKNASVLLLVFFIFISLIGYTQTSKNTWSVKWDYPKSFIENKGQFSLNQSNEKVLFAYCNGSTSIYFTEKGVRYSFLKRWFDTEKDEEKMENQAKNGSTEEWEEREEENNKMNYETDAVSFDWLNANSNVQVFGDEVTSDFHSYPIKQSDGSYNRVNPVKGYKKIIYKNIYPHIDVEFTFHPTDGIKYAVMLHPGADISKYKMSYSKNINFDNEGNIIIPTKFGDMIDHAPFTFYAGDKNNVIKSSFIQENNILSFKLDGYNNTQDVVIDPWVHTPTLANSNGVWECDKDAAGNVYIIGGDMPMVLQKYDAGGVLQWTYNTPWDTANNWLGTLAADLNGNSYITSGSVAAIQKISTTNNLTWSANGGAMDEYWMIAFNCDQTKLIVGGTRLNPLVIADSHGVIFDINTTDGSVMNHLNVVGARTYTLMGMPVTEPNEVRALTSSRDAKYYYLSLDSIGAINQNMTLCTTNGPLFVVSSTYNFSYKCENYRPSNGNSGIRAIRANNNFVYSQNGNSISKRSLIDGSVLATAAIPGGISTSVSMTNFNQPGNCGIAIDSCGNVYAGSGDRVVKFDADLNIITSVNLPFAVFDVVVSTGGNIVVCGATGTSASTSRTGYVQSIDMAACLPFALICCNTSVCPAGPFCPSDAPFQLVSETPGGTWSGAGVDPTSGVFTPSAAGVGSHTITYTLPCGSSSIIVVVNSCIPLAACLGLDSSITVSGGDAPYTWQQFFPATSSPITNQAECTACGYTWNGLLSQCLNGIFPVTSCDVAAHWTTIATGATVTPPVTFPIKAIDNYGESIVINDYASLPQCAPCPTITVTAANITNATCVGGNNGSFSASATGGVGPYNYTLLLGGTTIVTYNNVTGSQSFTGLAGGTYTLNVTDSLNCPGDTTVTIGENPFTVTAASNSPVCVGVPIHFTASGGSNYTWAGPNGFTSSTQNPTISPSTMSDAGTYYVTVSIPPCSDTVILHVVVNPSPIAYAGQDTTINSGVAITLHGSGGQTYSWSPSGTLNNPNIANPLATPYNSTTYTLTVTDSLGCSSIDEVIISVNPGALFVPNIFSPNGDGENDILYVYGTSIKEMKFYIYNRWGEKVFESTDRTNGWDGTFKGKPCDAGVFAYYLDVIYYDDNEVKLSGNVTLVR